MNKPLMSKKLFLQRNKHSVLPAQTWPEHLSYKVAWQWNRYDGGEETRYVNTTELLYNFFKANECAWWEVDTVFSIGSVNGTVVIESFRTTVNLRKFKQKDLAAFHNLLDNAQLLMELQQ